MGNLSNPNAYSGIVKGLGEGGGGSVDFPTDITNPQDGQLLQYDATSEKWVNVDNEPCVVDVLVTEEDRKATSDDVTNYVSDASGDPIVEGTDYHVFNFNISLNDLELNKIYRWISENDGFTVYDFSVSFKYKIIDNTYNIMINVGNITNEFYVANKDLNLKVFIIGTPSD